MDVNGCFVEWKKKYTALVVLDKKDCWVHVQQEHRKSHRLSVTALIKVLARRQRRQCRRRGLTFFSSNNRRAKNVTVTLQAP